MGSACSVNVFCLDDTEQILIKTLTDRRVVNGPGVKIVGVGKTGERRAGSLLGPQDYARVENTLSGEVRVARGPAMLFLGPYDRVQKTAKALVLGPEDYVVMKQQITGELSLVRGPCSHFPGAFDEVVERRKIIALKHNEYVRLVDQLTGVIRVERGEQAVVRSPTEELLDGGKKTAVAVDAETAVLVKDSRSGRQRLVTDRSSEAGAAESLFFPTAYDEIVKIQSLIKLAEYETVIVKDRVGQYHFVSGVLPAAVAPESGGGGADAPKGTVIQMGDVHCSESKEGGGGGKEGGGGGGGGGDFHVEVRKAASGGPNTGGVAFFLPPYCSLEVVNWSTGIHKDKKTMRKDVFDSRPWFCNYEFCCRTADNVELTLEVTFFWSLDNVPAMIRNTDDAPGDMCHHARSEIVQSVSQVDLRTFMERFNPIVKDTVMRGEDPFYAERGVRVHSVEVRSFQCKDGAIDKVLQQIIKETTDRINRLQKIESENEVRLEEMRGRIETERLKGGLVDVKNEHLRKEALMEGAAEAERIRAFIEGLGKDGTATKDDAIQLFNLLRRVDIFSELSKGNATMYFTPEDANLKFEQVHGKSLESKTASK